VTYRSGTVHRWQEQDTGGAFHVGARVRFQPKSHFHIDGVTLIRLDVVGKMVVGSKRDDASLDRCFRLCHFSRSFVIKRSN
jgi:hypothetical protein